MLGYERLNLFILACFNLLPIYPVEAAVAFVLEKLLSQGEAGRITNDTHPLIRPGQLMHTLKELLTGNIDGVLKVALVVLTMVSAIELFVCSNIVLQL